MNQREVIDYPYDWEDVTAKYLKGGELYASFDPADYDPWQNGYYSAVALVCGLVVVVLSAVVT